MKMNIVNEKSDVTTSDETMFYMINMVHNNIERVRISAVLKALRCCPGSLFVKTKYAKYANADGQINRDHWVLICHACDIIVCLFVFNQA